MQLITKMMVLVQLILPVYSQAQEQSVPNKTVLDPIEVNILASYYEQDGDHSPVTGGVATEDLTDFTPTVTVFVPLDANSTLSANLGVDFYTSASTDNIDTDVSSASNKDARIHLNVGYTRKMPKRGETYGITLAVSKEYDVLSFLVGASWVKESTDSNRELGINAHVFHDTWDLYLPVEFRTPKTGNRRGDDDSNYLTGDGQDSDTRTSVDFSLIYSQVLTKKFQASIEAGIVYQTGLLSTPFHRVFFNDGVDVNNLNNAVGLIASSKLRKIETLPGNRIKVPIGLRLNYYANNLVVFRFYYRYYHDDFGITGNTLSLDVPIKTSNYFSIFPFYRFHTQTAADHFKEFGQHDIGAKYFTSDFDLSSFESHKVGLGFRYSPLYGIVGGVKSLEIRYSRYFREDGLDASIISFGVS
ncbi:MAG: DUF3570 domain-containing protein, partial [Calditrichia bacterium]